VMRLNGSVRLTEGDDKKVQERVALG